MWQVGLAALVVADDSEAGRTLNAGNDKVCDVMGSVVGMELMTQAGL